MFHGCRVVELLQNSELSTKVFVILHYFCEDEGAGLLRVLDYPYGRNEVYILRIVSRTCTFMCVATRYVQNLFGMRLSRYHFCTLKKQP